MTESTQSCDRHTLNRNYGFPPETFDPARLPDIDHEFLNQEDLDAFAQALHAPDPLQGDDASSIRSPTLRSVSSFDITKRQSQAFDDSDALAVAAAAGAASGDVSGPANGGHEPIFITAQNDWAPVNEKIYRRSSSKRHKKKGRRRTDTFLGVRTKDETREGFFYNLTRWPILFLALAWLAGLGITYMLTRLYIWVYEQFVTWRGRRERLRRNMRLTNNYRDWVVAAKELDGFLGRQRWKEENEFAYYDSKTVRRVWEQVRKCRLKAEAEEHSDWSNRRGSGRKTPGKAPVDELRALMEACVKNNFVGVENPRLYSQTYYGTKNLVQNFIDEGE